MVLLIRNGIFLFTNTVLNINVTVSADNATPFGENSLFEISVPCDQVQAQCEYAIYGEQKQLVIGVQGSDGTCARTLKIVMRDDGELSVWPDAESWLAMWKHDTGSPPTRTD